VILTLRASAALGRALRLQRERRLTEALSLAQRELYELRLSKDRSGIRSERVVHASLVTLAESIACELNVSGASIEDLDDAFECLKSLSACDPAPELCDQIPFIVSRIAEIRGKRNPG
jgi:hypothetical protein